MFHRHMFLPVLTTGAVPSHHSARPAKQGMQLQPILCSGIAVHAKGATLDIYTMCGCQRQAVAYKAHECLAYAAAPFPCVWLVRIFHVYLMSPIAIGAPHVSVTHHLFHLVDHPPFLYACSNACSAPVLCREMECLVIMPL